MFNILKFPKNREFSSLSFSPALINAKPEFVTDLNISIFALILLVAFLTVAFVEDALKPSNRIEF